MNYQALLISVIVLALIPLVAAEELSCTAASERACAVLEELGVVEGASTPFVLPRTGVINLYFANDTVIGYLYVAQGRISSLVCCEESTEATHTATVASLEVIEEIRAAEKPLVEAHARMRSQELTLDAQRFSHNVRLALGRTLMQVASWFS